jgi:hypothetical protein
MKMTTRRRDRFQPELDRNEDRHHPPTLRMMEMEKVVEDAVVGAMDPADDLAVGMMT